MQLSIFRFGLVAFLFTVLMNGPTRMPHFVSAHPYGPADTTVRPRTPAAAIGPNLTVNAAASRHAISPGICVNRF